MDAVWLVDKTLLFLTRLFLGNTVKNGLKRPEIGPLELKNTAGKTPVLDIGAISKIKARKIKIVVLATGYRSNVPSWLKENDLGKIGIEKNPFPKGWKGEAGLYAVGYTRRGLSGASFDAMSVAHYIANSWKEETKQRIISVAARHRRCISHF